MAFDVYKALWVRIFGPNSLTAPTADNLMVVNADGSINARASSTARASVGTQTTTISASTGETTIVDAGAAGVFNDPIMIIISNTSAGTNTRIDFRDASGGTIRFSLQSIGGGAPVGFATSVPIPQTTAAAVWTAQCATSTTDIRIYVEYAKNT